jgi:hypothetical protein
LIAAGPDDDSHRPVYSFGFIVAVELFAQPVYLDPDYGIALLAETVVPAEDFGCNAELLDFLDLTAEHLFAEVFEEPG